MPNLVLIVLLQSLLWTYGTCSRYSLNDLQWTLSNRLHTVPGHVPGGIYSDLEQAGVIGNPLEGFNDINYRWVGLMNWTYSTTFNGSEVEQKPGEDMYLVFEGIDTIANITLNGKFVGSVDNMFVKNRFPIKSLLEGENELQVFLPSVVGQADQKSKQLSHIIPPECWPPSYNGECHINTLRKMQASFGWDWGPAFPSAGIWKPAYILSCSDPQLISVSTNLIDVDDVWSLKVKSWFEPCGSVSRGRLTVRLNIGNRSIITQKVTNLKSEPPFFHASANILIPKGLVELWWPNGYGGQQLYELEVIYETKANYQVSMTNIAFRTVELVQSPVVNNTSQGNLFYFKINGLDIFAKGSNWIPSSIFPEKSEDKTKITYLLESAAEAHFNMLRVWGGGVYESDFFYQECDRLGIMIWQDLMFACSMYPISEDFLKSVSTEISQQVVRLQKFPSIVIWAGNNENEAALRQNWYNTADDFAVYKSEYIKLYVLTIMPLVEQFDKWRPFVLSSPSNGLESIEEGFIAINPQSNIFGDVHYYNYLADLWDPNILPVPRFSSEYGIQSLPSLKTLSKVASEQDLVLNSEWLKSRQHQPGGYGYMKIETSYHLPEPKNLAHLIYLSQINQAMSMKVESEHYRRHKKTIYDTGEGYTMGALYWQLNDVWQAPSWASIDYDGNWKMLHYYAKDFFAPIIISAFQRTVGDVSVFLVSDLPDSRNLELRKSVFSTKSTIPLSISKYPVKTVPYMAEEVMRVVYNSVVDPCPSLTECLVEFSLVDSMNHIVSKTHFFAVNLEKMTLMRANITVDDCSLTDTRQITMTVSSDALALFIWIEVDIDGHFSDNGFHMTTSQRPLTFTASSRLLITPQEFCKRISTVHLSSEF